MIEMDGEVVSYIRDVINVQLDDAQVVKCHLGGKMRKHKINVVVGDRVRVKITPYDITRGIITLRHKKRRI